MECSITISRIAIIAARAVCLLCLAIGCNNSLRGQDSQPPKLSDLFGTPEAEDYRPASEDKKETINEASETYLCFGQTQVYAGPDEVWLFLDVDIHSTKPKGYSSFLERKAFHVFVFGKNGLRWKWKSKNEFLTAHENFVTFFRHQSETYAYNCVRDKLFRWSIEPPDGPGFIPCDARKREIGIVPGRLAQTVDHLLHLGQAEKFLRVSTENYGGGYGPHEALASEEPGLKIWFEPSGKGRLGWVRAIAKYMREKPPREEVLLDLAD